MKKKLLAIVLCLSLVFSSMSIAFAAESSMSLGTQYTGTISSTATEKTYSLTLSKSGGLNVTVMADMDALDLVLTGSDGKTLWSSTAKRNNNLGVISQSSDIQLASGSYKLTVKQKDSYTGTYKLTANFSASGESIAETAGGTNNTMDTADTITVSKTYKGHLSVNDTSDWYKFTLSKSGQLDLTVTWTGPHVHFGIYLPGDDKNRLWYNQNTMDGGLWGAGSKSYTIHLTAGTYYFNIQDSDGGGNYTLETSFAVSGETFAENNTGHNNDTILAADTISLGKTYKGQISSTDKNDYYQFTVSKDMTIWLSLSCERPKDFIFYDANGTEVTALTYRTSIEGYLNLKAGSYYFRAHGPYGYNTGNYTFKISEYKIDQPALKSVSNLKSGIKVKWSQVDFATGYNIYRKKSGGSWVKIDTVSGGDTLSYTDTTAKAGVKYSYSVSGFNSKLTSTYSKTGLTIKRLTQPVPTVANKSSSVKVSWKKVTGASGYYVYRKAASATKWTKVKTVTASNVLSYTDKNVKNGTKYTYAVKAYSGDYTSAQSASKKIVRLTKPTIKSVTNLSGKKLKITWGKNTKASGYQVQYSTKKSFSSKVTKTYSGSSNTTKTISSLKKGKTYYVRVRTYKKVNGVKYYSDWSKVKTKKVVK